MFGYRPFPRLHTLLGQLHEYWMLTSGVIPPTRQTRITVTPKGTGEERDGVLEYVSMTTENGDQMMEESKTL